MSLDRRALLAYAASAALAVLLALFVSRPAAAGVAATPTPPAAATMKPPIAATGNFTLRCWQNGMLIVEETNLPAPSANHEAVYFQKRPEDGPGLYVLNLHHGLCVIRQR